MGLSCRRFLVAADGTLYRLADTKFDRMLRDPTSLRLPDFAGQRVRMAGVAVELVDRVPACVVRTSFAVLAFDDEGHLDQRRFGQQQLALAETVIAPVLGVEDPKAAVVDAAARFVAQGGSWVPSSALARTIHQAAFGRLKCRRL